MIKMGRKNTLEVLRVADIAYVLSDGIEEIFLHKKQATRDLEEGESVDVFVYFDNLKRKTGSMIMPILDVENPAFCEVVDVKKNLGAFLNVGLIKDLLLSRDDMPPLRKQWPQIGDKLFVRMKVSRNQMTAKVIPRFETMQFLSPQRELEIGDKVDAYVIYFTEEGIVLLSEEGHNVFVYAKHYRGDYRLGQMANVKIINIRPDNTYNGTLIEQKEIVINTDAQLVLDYLEKHDGVMEITDKSSPEIIMETFNMSKGAFKRAIGTLYKSKTIIIEDSEVRLIKVEKE
jgi:predicted RNA-binding protein (virulence factor B family)